MGSSTVMLPTVLPTSMGASAPESSCVRPLGFRLRPARSTCATSMGSPPPFEFLAKNDCGRIHDHEEGQEHDDRARGFLDESTLGTVGPEIGLHGQHGRGIG